MRGVDWPYFWTAAAGSLRCRAPGPGIRFRAVRAAAAPALFPLSRRAGLAFERPRTVGVRMVAPDGFEPPTKGL